MSECPTLDWTRAKREPAPLDRVEPDTTDWFEGDISRDIDCAATGVTIINAVPSIRPEDDDGNLTFGVVQLTGTTFRIPYTVDPAATQAMYAIDVTVTTSDARTLHYWHTLPVVPTTPLHA